MYPFLYPETTPYDQGFIQVSPLHLLYYEQCGNPEGVPVIVLHGGPGAGFSSQHPRFFDPEYYRIILFDQRGTQRSLPFGEIQDNSPDHLREDIELIRKHFKIDSWHVFGGSWGSALALHYAFKYPQNVKSLTLRGLFCMTWREIDWFLTGMAHFYPEAFERFLTGISDVGFRHGDPLTAEHLLDLYLKALFHQDQAIVQKAARAWYNYETACVSLLPDKLHDYLDDSEASLKSALSLSRFEAYFFKHYFFEMSYFEENIAKIRHIPASLVQGRYDMVCPIETADKLHLAWAELDYQIIPDAGHSAFEPGIAEALVQKMNLIRDQKR